ncbi:GNAT family N-acetyltransferase [Psychrobacillus sp. FSL K6-2684]|uniref:GNAT family N-acetyltransferase n=1 Tax=Psychrobacillus faecigallinarum TaxID=2762235 RepID=A0ABR8R764_9BACI|nr:MULTISPECIES: GNAT family N-acetyltransferase [Psychrobacillus]MBD7943624.1 GNAT family N-acetyltransferase [Psychrobacillus faecigallinarum]QEY22773.1 N-acetyltransferase [Psychrobacillus sp. AK 1817]
MNIVGETERLCLVVFEERFLDSAKLFWGDNDVMKSCGGASSHEALPRTIEFYRECHEEKNLSVYAVMEKSSGEIIGAAGFNVEDKIEEVELIYHFNKKSWGKGYATEAVAACMDIVRNHPNVLIVSASASIENAGSLKILERAGFTYLGLKWFDDTQQEEPVYEYRPNKETILH